MKLYNFGSLNTDHVYDVVHHVKTGETISASAYNVYIGGKGLNQSIAASKAGADVVHVGVIGPDGLHLKKALTAANVDVSSLIQIDKPSGHAIIQINEAGDNNIVVYGGSNMALDKASIDSVFKLITEDDLVLIQNEISNVDYIVEKAYALNIPVALNYSPITKSLDLIDLNHVTYLLVNELEGQAAAGFVSDRSVVDVLTEKYPNLHVVMTLGDKGVVYAKHGQPNVTQPGFKVEVVDTTGAGDTFTGYFVAAIAANRGIQSALELSCKASALAIGKNGASNAIPELQEVLNYE